MPMKTLRQLLHEVDPDLNIVSRSQYRHGAGNFPLPPSIQEIYGLLEAFEERISRVEAILKKLPENVIEELSLSSDTDELDEGGKRILEELRQLEQRTGLKLHPKLKMINVVLTIQKHDSQCFVQPPKGEDLHCPCSDPSANGCDMFTV